MFHLTDLLQHYAQAGKTGTFDVTGPGNSGQICLNSGIVTHAETDDNHGDSAFFQILSWEGAPYEWHEGDGSHPVTMSAPVEELLLQFIVRQSEGTLPGPATAETTGLLPTAAGRKRETRLVPKGSIRYRLEFAIQSHEIAPMRYTITLPELTAGRTPDNALCVPDTSVSRRHAQLNVLGDSVLVRDLGSKNGTLIDGHPISQGLLRHGQIMTLGEVNCTLSVTVEAAPAAGQG